MNKKQSKLYNKLKIEETILRDNLYKEILEAKLKYDSLKNKFQVLFNRPVYTRASQYNKKSLEIEE